MFLEASQYFQHNVHIHSEPPLSTLVLVAEELRVKSQVESCEVLKYALRQSSYKTQHFILNLGEYNHKLYNKCCFRGFCLVTVIVLIHSVTTFNNYINTF